MTPNLLKLLKQIQFGEYQDRCQCCYSNCGEGCKENCILNNTINQEENIIRSGCGNEFHDIAYKIMLLENAIREAKKLPKRLHIKIVDDNGQITTNMDTFASINLGWSER